MRSTDFMDKERTYSRLNPTEMIRVALVNGLNANMNTDDSKRYIEMVKHFTNLRNPNRVNRLASIISEDRITRKQEAFLDDLIKEVDYQNDAWKRFNYQTLKMAGVVEEVDGLSELVESAAPLLKGSFGEYGETSDLSKVLVVKGDLLDPDRDYLKHIHWRNKLRLDSNAAMEHLFGSLSHEKFMSSLFRKYGVLSKSDLENLNRRGFTFQNALYNALDVLIESESKSPIVTISFKNPTTANETRVHMLDFIEAAERYLHRKFFTKEEIVTGEIDYARREVQIPKRTPTAKMGEFNRLEAHYYPHHLYVSKGPTSWMYTLAHCDCEHAFNSRNYNTGKGAKLRVVNTWDVHFLDYSLEKVADTGIKTLPDHWSLTKANHLSIIPSAEFVGVANFLRNNVFVESNKTRRSLKEPEIEAVIFEMIKKPRYLGKGLGLIREEYAFEEMKQEIFAPMYLKPELR